MKSDTIRFCWSIVVFGSLTLQQCGKPPASEPALQSGSVRVVAMDTASIDSMFIGIDDVNLGLHANPHILEGVLAGLHKVSVSDRTTLSSTAMIDIVADRRAEAVIWLMTEGAYVGQVAPEFAANDINGQTFDLYQMRGRLVLLAFFEHT